MIGMRVMEGRRILRPQEALLDPARPGIQNDHPSNLWITRTISTQAVSR
jgi:hypothetical protein